MPMEHGKLGTLIDIKIKMKHWYLILGKEISAKEKKKQHKKS